MIFYLFFTVVASVLFWVLIGEIASGSESRFREGLPGVWFTIFSLVTITVSAAAIFWIVVELVRQKRTDQLQGGLKLRLTGYFSGFAFLVTVPQVVLAVMIVFASTDKWLPLNTEQVILKSRSSLLESRDQKLQNLRELCGSRIFNDYLERMVVDPKKSSPLWDEIKEINSLISAVQVFDEFGNEHLFLGDSSCRMRYNRSVRDSKEGEMPEQRRRDVSIFRFLIEVTCNKERPCKAVVSLIQPVSEFSLIKDLSDLSEHYKPLIESRTWIRNNIMLVLFLFMLIINLVSIYISIYLSNLIIMPILDIEQATRKVAGGDFSVRLYPDKGNNFALLANSFNKMVFDLEKLQKNSSHFNKMKAWQDIARRMAHEINNPLTPIRLSAERMLRKFRKGADDFGPVVEKASGVIISEVENLEALLHDFRAFSRLPEPRFEPIPIDSLIEETVELYRHLNQTSITISVASSKEPITVRADRKQLKQVFSNLLKNAMEALDEGGKINLSTALVSRQNIKYCRIVLEDNGRGIPQELLDNIFTPYFTTKNEGTGLGLSIVERIVFAHKGKVRVASHEGSGTTFIIDLPVE